jgi:hypothetical protein
VSTIVHAPQPTKPPKRARPDRGSSRTVRMTVAGLALIAVIGVGVGLLARTSYDLLIAALVAPVLVAISLPALFKQAARENDPLFALMLIGALLAKLAGGFLRYYVAFGIYGGRSDAAAYWTDGLTLGPNLRHGIFPGVHLFGLSGTNFIRFISGVTVAGIGPSLLGGYLVFAWLGFWGLFLFYRAFTIAVPEGSRRWYAALVFFLPSLIFWPSGVGKEAWMLLGLGLTAFGAARMLSGRSWNGLIYAALGFATCAFVRPQIAALVAIALVMALLLRPSNPALGTLGPIAKAAALLPILVVAGFLVVRADAFLKASGINTSKGVGTVLTQTTSRTQQGGSRFTPSVLNSPGRAPGAVVTVLFRPLLFEAHDTQSAFAALEGTLLIALCIFHYRWIAQAFRMLRRRAYLMLALVYTALFVAAYSSIANFGILVRERVQVLPFLLVLLCVPPLKRRADAAPRHRRSRAET